MRFIEQLTRNIVKTVNSNSTAQLIGLQLELAWGDNVRNTHYAPRGKSTNWYSKPDLPTGYPGWGGRVWARFNNMPANASGSSFFSNTGLHIGTGGFGSYNGPWQNINSTYFQLITNSGRNARKQDIVKYEPKIYGWDCKIFAEDFLEIFETFEQDRLIDILSDKESYYYRFLVGKTLL